MSTYGRKCWIEPKDRWHPEVVQEVTQPTLKDQTPSEEVVTPTQEVVREGSSSPPLSIPQRRGGMLALLAALLPHR